MSSFIKRSGILPLALLMAIASTARGELPPGAYDELLRDAQELLQIRVDRVTEQQRISGDMRNFEVLATVIKVDRSKAKLAPGARIRFASYYVPPEVFARGFAGPKSPPLLSAGWQGKIYLNRDAGKPDFMLAAYGRSFLPSGRSAAATPAPAPPSDRLGIRAYPAPSGGLLVRTVERNSLADDLGLRGGERLIEINGQAINAAADVGPALQSNKDQLQIKFERADRPLDLTLRRTS
ncbi:MAG TPA: PDZ domain-containing protein [Pirellulales bacterium]|jgi:membrane-associated protease RseP (regulator of RpoE activity)